MYQLTLNDNYHHTIQIVLHYNEWQRQTNIFWEARAVPLPSFHEKLLLLIDLLVRRLIWQVHPLYIKKCPLSFHYIFLALSTVWCQILLGLAWISSRLVSLFDYNSISLLMQRIYFPSRIRKICEARPKASDRQLDCETCTSGGSCCMGWPTRRASIMK